MLASVGVLANLGGAEDSRPPCEGGSVYVEEHGTKKGYVGGDG